MPAFFMVRFPEVEVPSAVPVLFIILLALPTVWAFLKSQNIIKTSAIYTALTILAISIELIGVKTGFPYGEFWYSDLLPAKVAGEVPLTLSLTFVPILIGAYALARKLFKKSINIVILTTILLVLADLVLDPGAVKTGMWTFKEQGLYYGVPLTNYLGWVFSGLIFATLCNFLFKKVEFKNPNLIFTYKATVYYWAIVCLFSGLIIPCILGLIIYLYIDI